MCLEKKTKKVLHLTVEGGREGGSLYSSCPIRAFQEKFDLKMNLDRLHELKLLEMHFAVNF